MERPARRSRWSPCRSARSPPRRVPGTRGLPGSAPRNGRRCERRASRIGAPRASATAGASAGPDRLPRLASSGGDRVLAASARVGEAVIGSTHSSSMRSTASPARTSLVDLGAAREAHRFALARSQFQAKRARASARRVGGGEGARGARPPPAAESSRSKHRCGGRPPSRRGAAADAALPTTTARADGLAAADAAATRPSVASPTPLARRAGPPTTNEEDSPDGPSRDQDPAGCLVRHPERRRRAVRGGGPSGTFEAVAARGRGAAMATDAADDFGLVRTLLSTLRRRWLAVKPQMRWAATCAVKKLRCGAAMGRSRALRQLRRRARRGAVSRGDPTLRSSAVGAGRPAGRGWWRGARNGGVRLAMIVADATPRWWQRRRNSASRAGRWIATSARVRREHPVAATERLLSRRAHPNQGERQRCEWRGDVSEDVHPPPRWSSPARARVQTAASDVTAGTPLVSSWIVPPAVPRRLLHQGGVDRLRRARRFRAPTTPSRPRAAPHTDRTHAYVRMCTPSHTDRGRGARRRPLRAILGKTRRRRRNGEGPAQRWRPDEARARSA